MASTATRPEKTDEDQDVKLCVFISRRDMVRLQLEKARTGKTLKSIVTRRLHVSWKSDRA